MEPVEKQTMPIALDLDEKDETALILVGEKIKIAVSGTEAELIGCRLIKIAAQLEVVHWAKLQRQSAHASPTSEDLQVQHSKLQHHPGDACDREDLNTPVPDEPASSTGERTTE